MTADDIAVIAAYLLIALSIAVVVVFAVVIL